MAFDAIKEISFEDNHINYDNVVRAGFIKQDHEKSLDQVSSKYSCFSRPVYNLLGLPVDAIAMPDALDGIKSAARQDNPFLLSTPNLNFLIKSLSDKQFRESVLLSDMSTADGMPLVWMSRILGLPVKERVAGSALFEELAENASSERPLRVFLFGGADGVAEKASAEINAKADGIECVGWFNPGFGSIEEMSRPEIISEINSSGADFIVVALGAVKGQEWLLHNHDRLAVPVRSHLGACMNFQAGTAKRAPGFMQKSGLEWLWRIKEEPQLWRRYWSDGLALCRLTATRLLPLAIHNWRNRKATKAQPQPLVFSKKPKVHADSLILQGDAIVDHIEAAISEFKRLFSEGQRNLHIDLSGVRVIDQRFIGLLMMLRKQAAYEGKVLKILAETPVMKQAFRLNEVSYLLDEEQPAALEQNEDALVPVHFTHAKRDTYLQASNSRSTRAATEALS